MVIHLCSSTNPVTAAKPAHFAAHMLRRGTQNCNFYASEPSED